MSEKHIAKIEYQGTVDQLRGGSADEGTIYLKTNLFINTDEGFAEAEVEIALLRAHGRNLRIDDSLKVTIEVTRDDEEGESE